jgi:subtilase family serine protease
MKNKTLKIPLLLAIILSFCINVAPVEATYHFDTFRASPPIHVLGSSKTYTAGLSPDTIKKVYNLPTTGGHGTIAIIAAYHDPNIEKDLAVFNDHFQIKSCTTNNGCLEIHKMSGSTETHKGWSLETSLDVEWAHAIAPTAQILLVEAPTPSGTNLIDAIDYARSRRDVVAISMSWGGGEFQEETSLDKHFTSDHGIVFFSSSGDSGHGVSWPAVSPNVIAVGGTSLKIANGLSGSNSNSNSSIATSESAWSGSGGGVSIYEKEPAYQNNYNIPKSNGMRAIPDVSYNADPQSGFAVYRSTPSGSGKWYVLGGTSAGSPQWAAIHSLGLSVSHDNLYRDKSSTNDTNYFRDITSGNNGTCSYYCTSRKHYDYVTGLGSPLTVNF